MQNAPTTKVQTKSINQNRMLSSYLAHENLVICVWDSSLNIYFLFYGCFFDFSAWIIISDSEI